ncbi:fluoride efflux transporter FluC [Cohnella caldifontis]|uniref:fluoride efflux transporter FluC n=1 Tax=Cohnella caldifontis TaxID=3027471 RepID=UPI0023ECF563|nr:CrcB family protein [Cohnella sp. YIM B05605]
MSAPEWFIAFGGLLGALCRFGLSSYLKNKVSSPFPWGTFTVNLLGSLSLGILAGSGVAPSFYFFAGTGFMGAFTTFSTFKLDALQLGRRNERVTFVLYLAATYIGGILLAWLGYWAASTL